MKENKNNTLLTTLIELDINKLKDDELIKVSKNISKNINVNGLRRNINTTLIQILETTDTSMDNNQKIEFIKKLLKGQKTIETNVRNFRRKSSLPKDVKDVTLFIKTTTEILKAIQQYQPLKEEKKLKETKAVETKKPIPSTKVTKNSKK